MPASVFPTHELLGNYHEIHNSGYHLFADNWFSCTRVVREMHALGVGYTGTVRVNRVDKAFTDTKEWKKKAERGHMRARKTTAAAGPPTIYCTQWMDKKPVTFLTTEPGVVGSIDRKVSDKKARTYQKKSYTVPSCVTNYNQGKVGTDRMDQMIAMLYFKNRFRWHVKCFIHFMYIILNNAHVTWKEIRDPLPGVDMSKTALRHYVMLMVHELCIAEKLWVTHEDNHDGVLMHTPATVPSKKGQRKKQGRCVSCSTDATTRCKACSEWIHIDGHAEGKACWSTHHRSLNFFK